MTTALDFIKTTFENRNRESLILIINDDLAKRVLIAWTLYQPTLKDFDIKATDNPIIVLDRLWAPTLKEMDIERLALIAGVPSTRAAKIFDRLRVAALIFPDGTAAPNALSVVRAEVASYIQDMMPRRGPLQPAPQPAPAPAENPAPRHTATRTKTRHR